MRKNKKELRLLKEEITSLKKERILYLKMCIFIMIILVPLGIFSFFFRHQSEFAIKLLSIAIVGIPVNFITFILWWREKKEIKKLEQILENN